MSREMWRFPKFLWMQSVHSIYVDILRIYLGSWGSYAYLVRLKPVVPQPYRLLNWLAIYTIDGKIRYILTMIFNN